MWAAITLTVHLLLAGERPAWIWAGMVCGLGGVGTWFIVRHGRAGGEVSIGTGSGPRAEED